jgi:hypothetical protein
LHSRPVLPRLGPVHAAALGLAVVTSLYYVEAVTGRYDETLIPLLWYPLIMVMASFTRFTDALILTLAYVAGYAAAQHLGNPSDALILLPLLAALGPRRLLDAAVSLVTGLGLWLVSLGNTVLGVGLAATAIGLGHMATRGTAKGLSSAEALFLASALIAGDALIPVVLLYSLYLYVEMHSRELRPYVDRGLVVAGLATQSISILAFMFDASIDIAWMLIASASYFLAAGLMIPRPSA